MARKVRNTFEKRISSLLKRRKAKFSYETEKIPYTLTGHYIPDFIIETSSGKIYLETKGYLRRPDKRKMVAVKKQHPELDIRILFYSRKEEDIRWAEKNGFPYAIKDLPKEWI